MFSLIILYVLFSFLYLEILKNPTKRFFLLKYNLIIRKPKNQHIKNTHMISKKKLGDFLIKKKFMKKNS